MTVHAKNTILFTLSLLCFVACSEDEPQIEPGDGEIFLNGELLQLGGASAFSNCGTGKLEAALVHTNKSNGRSLQINISNLPAQTGSYTLQNEPSVQNRCTTNLLLTNARTSYQNVLAERFSIIESSTINELIITRFDTIAARLDGRFQMTLVLEEQIRSDPEDFSDTLRITYGTFSVPILPND